MATRLGLLVPVALALAGATGCVPAGAVTSAPAATSDEVVVAVADRVPHEMPPLDGHSLLVRETLRVGDVTQSWGHWGPGRADRRSPQEFWLTERGGQLAGVLGVGDGTALLVGTDDATGGPVISAPVRARRPGCDVAAHMRSCDDDLARPVFVAAAERRIADVAFLFTPRALAWFGGRRTVAEHAASAAFARAEEAFRVPGIAVELSNAGVFPVGGDEGRDDLETLWADVADPRAARFGAEADLLRRALGAELVVLIVGGPATSDHGVALRPTSPDLVGVAPYCYAVVHVAQLRHGDQTLAHEIGHLLGLEHGAGGVMDAGTPERPRGLAAAHTGR